MKEQTETNSSKDAGEKTPLITSQLAQLLPPKTRKERGTLTAPLPGFVWNPLRSLPRNNPCPCLSGKKFKVCCLHSLPWAVPKSVAEQFLEQMSRDGLVFLTKENEARVKALHPGQQMPGPIEMAGDLAAQLAGGAAPAAQCRGCGAKGPHDCKGPFEVK